MGVDFFVFDDDVEFLIGFYLQKQREIQDEIKEVDSILEQLRSAPEE
jgi:hypothetical protein